MKVIITYCIFLWISCASKGSSATVEPTPSFTPEQNAQHSPQAPEQDSNRLCQINGVDWYYTTVRCRKIMSTDYKPRKKYAFNFSNKNTLAKENISLLYNADTRQLEYVDITLTDPASDEGRRVFISIKPVTSEEIQQIGDIGTLIDITDNTVSGNAEFSVPKNSKGIYNNALDQDMVITNFQFSNIPFDDESEY